MSSTGTRKHWKSCDAMTRDEARAYYPLRTLELNELQPWGHGIADVWIIADEWPALLSSSWYTIID